MFCFNRNKYFQEALQGCAKGCPKQIKDFVDFQRSVRDFSETARKLFRDSSDLFSPNLLRYAARMNRNGHVGFVEGGPTPEYTRPVEIVSLPWEDTHPVETVAWDWGRLLKKVFIVFI